MLYFSLAFLFLLLSILAPWPSEVACSNDVADISINNINKINSNRCVGAYDTEGAFKIPSGRPIRWAIVALAKPNDGRLKIRNAAIAEKMKPFASKHDITAVFFSELPISSEVSNDWQSTFASSNIKLQIINTAHHGFHNLPGGEGGEVRPKESTITYGYKYMCKFFAIDMYSHLKNFDFYIRIDSDCFLKTLKFDVFQWAVDVNLGYGYLARKLEAHGPTKQTLPGWTQKYSQKCGISPRSPMDQPMHSCFNFYNNFHIGRVSFFNRPEVFDFLRAANESGRILSHRWGDSTIQAYAVRLFMEPAALLRIPNITYVHGSHANMVVSSVDGVHTNLPQKLPIFDGRQYNDKDLWLATPHANALERKKGSN